jgi:hypothetical protein
LAKTSLIVKNRAGAAVQVELGTAGAAFGACGLTEAAWSGSARASTNGGSLTEPVAVLMLAAFTFALSGVSLAEID